MIREMDDCKQVYHAEQMKQSKSIYHPPLGRKRPRATHHRGRSGKAHCYTPEEILLYKMRLAAEALNH